MINKDRIVPIQAVDLLSMYAFILKAAGTTLTIAEADSAEGDFTLSEAPLSGSVFANEPVKTFNFGEDVTAATVYFVPAYDYKGFAIDGVAVVPGEDDLVPDADGRTLYLATLATGAVTITKISY